MPGTGLLPLPSLSNADCSLEQMHNVCHYVIASGRRGWVGLAAFRQVEEAAELDDKGEGA